MTVSTVTALLIAVLPVFGWTSEVIGTVSAALVVLAGAVSAALVSVDRLLPLLVGVGKAVLAVVAAFGLHVPDNQVAALMAVLTVIGGVSTRAQVGAVEPPRDRHGNDVRALPGPIQLPGHLAGHLASETVAGWRAAEQAMEQPRRATPPADGPHEAHTEVFPTTARTDSRADGGEGERGGEGRHAHRGWITGRLRPDHGV